MTVTDKRTKAWRYEREGKRRRKIAMRRDTERSTAPLRKRHAYEPKAG